MIGILQVRYRESSSLEGQTAFILVLPCMNGTIFLPVDMKTAMLRDR